MGTDEDAEPSSSSNPDCTKETSATINKDNVRPIHKGLKLDEASRLWVKKRNPYVINPYQQQHDSFPTPEEKPAQDTNYN